jgi:receptor-type tyrosine-protein phosphatase N
MKKIVSIYYTVVLTGTFCVVFGSQPQQYASAVDRAYGLVGCRFSAALCSFDETCVYDGLFGNCQKVHSLFPDFYQYQLNEIQQHELELILLQLIDSGYTWSHDYTQCVITNILLAYRQDISFDLGFCNMKPPYDLDFPDDSPTVPRWQQKITINSGKQGAEERYFYQPRTEDLPVASLPPMPVSDGIKRFEDNENVDSPEIGEFEEFLSGLSRRELESLKKYVSEEEERPDDVQVEGGWIVSQDIQPDQQTAGDYAEHDWNAQSVIDKKDDRVDLEPMMMTRVVVNYDPGDQLVAENAAFEKENSDKISDSDEHQPSIEQANEINSMERVGSFDTGKSFTEISVPPIKPTVIKPSPVADALAAELPSVSALNGYSISGAGSGIVAERIDQSKLGGGRVGQKYLITMYILCGLVGGVTLAAITIYLVRRRSRLQEKLAQWVTAGQQLPSEEYQDLCRQHMQAKFSEKSEVVLPTSRIEAVAAVEEKAVRTGSTGSSTSSWSEEPVSSNLDISTGHIVLSYMEDHLKNKDRLQKEWDTLCAYDAEPCSVVAAIEPTNMRKNRYSDILPYEHSRVRLTPASNVSNSDYINASTITDHDPRNPAYIATQGPLPHTVADFWQMIWEQGSIVIVNLTRLTENSVTVCHRYWPEEGSDLYHIYEVHLVSEHVWCEDYIIRSFYLKNLQTNETRTVTQFHFIAWPNNDVPSSAKTLLDFRRKVNKSFRCRSSPVIVHCSDGAGRTGTYCLIDMVLSRLSKGAKEIDIAATLEHIRDQRINMVRTKEQFEFALTAVAQEVQAILHAPTQ